MTLLKTACVRALGLVLKVKRRFRAIVMLLNRFPREVIIMTFKVI
jgi:hypothetical protein